MKLAFSTLGCPDWSFDEITATAKDLGFNGFEVRGVGNQLYAPAIPQFSAGKLDATLARLSKLNVEISCLTSACCFKDEGALGENLAGAEAYIELAAKTGVPYIRVMGDATAGPVVEVDDNVVISGLSLAAKKAEEMGVTLLVETNGVYSDTARLLKVIEAVGSKNVAVLWDVHHPVRYKNESVETTYKNIGKYVKYVHIKDSVMENGTVKYKMMGYGDLPLKEIIGCLKESGYDGYVSLEWVKRWCAELEAPGVVFNQYISYMRKALR